MPTCGKTTIGKQLAKVLHKPFVDTDKLIQDFYDKTLKELIKEYKIEGFLDLESRVVLENHYENSIVSTGGSVVYSKEAMKYLKECAIVIYLNNSYDTIHGRLKNIKSRGVVIHQGKTLEELYHERIPLYEQYADIVIEADEKSIKEIVNEIQEKINF